LLHQVTLGDAHILGRNPLNEGSACCRELYLTTHNTHKRQTSMTLAGIEPAVPASERPLIHSLDRAASEFGVIIPISDIIRFVFVSETVWNIFLSGN